MCTDLERRLKASPGFRLTFRDWAGETYQEGHEVPKRALALVGGCFTCLGLSSMSASCCPLRKRRVIFLPVGTARQMILSGSFVFSYKLA